MVASQYCSFKLCDKITTSMDLTESPRIITLHLPSVKSNFRIFFRFKIRKNVLKTCFACVSVKHKTRKITSSKHSSQIFYRILLHSEANLFSKIPIAKTSKACWCFTHANILNLSTSFTCTYIR